MLRKRRKAAARAAARHALTKTTARAALLRACRGLAEATATHLRHLPKATRGLRKVAKARPHLGGLAKA